MHAYDLNGDGVKELVTGWSNGKVGVYCTILHQQFSAIRNISVLYSVAYQHFETEYVRLVTCGNQQLAAY